MNKYQGWSIARVSMGRKSLILWMVVIASTWSPLSFAYRFQVNSLEWMASSPMCRAALVNKYAGWDLAVLDVPNVGKDNGLLIWNVGGWHYCGGVVRSKRAKLITDPKKRESMLEEALKDIDYSYTKIPKDNWWAVEMAISRAKVLQDMGKTDSAFSELERIEKFHNGDHRIYTARGIMEFDRGNFEVALKQFERANELQGWGSSQDYYFSGLAAFKLENYDLARKYAAEAKEMGYPLEGLEKMLSTVSVEK